MTFTPIGSRFSLQRVALVLVFAWGMLLTMPHARADDVAWQALENGRIVLFRHALAPGTGDPANFTLGDCSTQRNLNDKGRADSRAIGQAFQDKGINVGRVLTSQWCRCVETAELAFPGQVEEEPVFNSFFQNRSAGPEQTRAAQRILEQWLGDGALVVITHQVNITALTDIFPQSGEGIVIQINNGEIDVIGRLRI
ncbi:histidine phosphatase family protein [Roseibium alexandrii]|uniref:Phosphohistidine phosphatase SixA n=1 Tax=Roseibium alexandrii (strain DSM 17067 / NCIMB 14079 / DFL-11) TaxID=244592 RepID=A0A5E8H501_ROSAD|nr:histidine phosphatase family protein [Roseibium alexandrii]EEE47795.2 Phosphohistidine phosphatase SixA [Roseibium alexandrii DFL-11]